MRKIFAILFLVSIFSVSGCGLWDDITGQDGTDEVTLKGEAGSSCSLDSECRSNSCVYPGICE